MPMSIQNGKGSIDALPDAERVALLHEISSPGTTSKKKVNGFMGFRGISDSQCPKIILTIHSTLFVPVLDLTAETTIADPDPAMARRPIPRGVGFPLGRLFGDSRYPPEGKDPIPGLDRGGDPAARTRAPRPVPGGARLAARDARRRVLARAGPISGGGDASRVAVDGRTGAARGLPRGRTGAAGRGGGAPAAREPRRDAHRPGAAGGGAGSRHG